MALQWISTTMVKAYLHSQTPLSEQQITEIAECSEHYIEDVAKLPSSLSFDANKHRILRESAALRAALLVGAACPLSLQTLEAAGQTLDAIRDALMGDLTLLSDQNFVLYLTKKS